MWPGIMAVDTCPNSNSTEKYYRIGQLAVVYAFNSRVNLAKPVKEEEKEQDEGQEDDGSNEQEGNEEGSKERAQEEENKGDDD